MEYFHQSLHHACWEVLVLRQRRNAGSDCCQRDVGAQAAKNGVVIPNCGVSGSGGQTLWIGLTCGVYVDANGTDYFEWVANQAIAGMNAQGGNMSAFRIG